MAVSNESLKIRGGELDEELPISPHLRRCFDLYENERYTPITGFSSKGLMPSDRYAFSTQDGTSGGWNTVQDAETELLSAGWHWVGEKWHLDKSTHEDVGEEGWVYAADFKTFVDASCGVGGKAMLHFVRRRRITRFQSFDEDTIGGGFPYLKSCNFCDLHEVSCLSSMILEKFVAASFMKHPRNLTLTKICVLKNELIKALGLYDEDCGPYEQVSVCRRLDTFVRNSQTALSRASSALSVVNEEITEHRKHDIDHFYFTIEERERIAKLLIRRSDFSFQFHCPKLNCGSSCEFAAKVCPNDNCEEVYSAKWSLRHDAECPHKLLECSRKCGEQIPRRLSELHYEEECSLRPARCHLFAFGCNHEIPHRDLGEHMQLHQTEHLLLLLQRVQEHEQVIVSLNHKVKRLESDNESQNKQIIALQGTLATSTATLATLEVKQSKELQSAVYKVDQKTSKRLDRDTARLEDEIGELRQKVTAKTVFPAEYDS